ncbi:hypothetical protein LTR08_002393 [Meristemomyces frigidus]|nr:hypothetical protein LTR08_002393 [Meristemomyces frigidus]
MSIFASTPPAQQPDSALRLPAQKRISTPISQRLSTITEGPKAGMAVLEPPPKLILPSSGSGADSPRLSETLCKASDETARTRQSSQDTARKASHDTARAYTWVRESLGADGALSLPIEDEKLAHLRRGGGDRRRRRSRGGWGRLILIIALVLLVVTGLAVGLGVGLTRKKQYHSDGSSNGSSQSAGSTPDTAIIQQYPLGEYSMITSLREVTSNCTSNPATWRCYPYSIFNPTDASTNTSSLATFNWIITNTSSIYATNSTPATPSQGIHSNLTISSTNNPFSITFTNLSLTYLNPTSSNASAARYTFTFQMSKSVIPDTAITTNNAAATCFYNQTSFTGTLYLAAPRTFPSADLAESTGIGGYTPWPYALQITQSSPGGENAPACYETMNGHVGARITTGLTPQSVGTVLMASATAQQVNRTITNGWGSTPAQRHYINHTQALCVINAGIEYSSVPNNIAVLDPSSQLVAFLRMDNAYLGSVDISIKKAKTVTSFNGQFPSYGLLDSSQPGGDLFGIEQTNGGLVVFGGGQPIFDYDGYFIGAVGISGGTVDQDVATSVKAAESIGTTITT